MLLSGVKPIAGNMEHHQHREPSISQIRQGEMDRSADVLLWYLHMRLSNIL